MSSKKSKKSLKLVAAPETSGLLEPEISGSLEPLLELSHMKSTIDSFIKQMKKVEGTNAHCIACKYGFTVRDTEILGKIAMTLKLHTKITDIMIMYQTLVDGNQGIYKRLMRKRMTLPQIQQGGGPKIFNQIALPLLIMAFCFIMLLVTGGELMEMMGNTDIYRDNLGDMAASQVEDAIIKTGEHFFSQDGFSQAEHNALIRGQDTSIYEEMMAKVVTSIDVPSNEKVQEFNENFNIVATAYYKQLQSGFLGFLGLATGGVDLKGAADLVSHDWTRKLAVEQAGTSITTQLQSHGNPMLKEYAKILEKGWESATWRRQRTFDKDRLPASSEQMNEWETSNKNAIYYSLNANNKYGFGEQPFSNKETSGVRYKKDENGKHKWVKVSNPVGKLEVSKKVEKMGKDLEEWAKRVHRMSWLASGGILGLFWTAGATLVNFGSSPVASSNSPQEDEPEEEYDDMFGDSTGASKRTKKGKKKGATKKKGKKKGSKKKRLKKRFTTKKN